MKEELKVTGQGTLHGKDFGTIKLKNEELKITGQGTLHGKDFGILKLDDKLTTEKEDIIYDNKLNQYCVNGQWEIPFVENENENKIEQLFNYLIHNIKEEKQKLVKYQKFEPASHMRDIEITLLNLKEEYKKIKKG